MAVRGLLFHLPGCIRPDDDSNAFLAEPRRLLLIFGLHGFDFASFIAAFAGALHIRSFHDFLC
jgi:hypothetical protein